MQLNHRGWLRLIGYCVGVVLATALGLAVVLAGATVTFAAGQSAEPVGQTSFSGMVTDERCGAKHERYPGKSASECARMCALDGSKYVLLSGDNVYTLTGKDLALDKLAGLRATITGTLEGTTLNVVSVSAEHP